MDDGPHGERRHDRTLAHTADIGHEEVGEQAGQQHQRQVEGQLRIAEVEVVAAADDLDQIFAGRHRHVDPHLERDARRQNEAPDDEPQQLGRIGHRLEPEEHQHGAVDEESEAERDGNLQQVGGAFAAQILARHEEEVQQHEGEVEQDGPLPHRERREHAQHVVHARDG